MKVSLTVATFVILGLLALAVVTYDWWRAEQCDVAEVYELASGTNSDLEALLASSRNFADASGYKLVQSSREGELTLYGARDADRLVINVNTSQPGAVRVSFYDCRRGGNGSASAASWLREVGGPHLERVPPNNSFKPKPLRGSA